MDMSTYSRAALICGSKTGCDAALRQHGDIVHGLDECGDSCGAPLCSFNSACTIIRTASGMVQVDFHPSTLYAFRASPLLHMMSDDALQISPFADLQ